jgi:YOP proteins translocation protein K (YscK)
MSEADVRDQKSELSAEWDAFMRYPVAYIETSRLEVCFDGRLGTGLCERLKNAARLRDRVSAMIIERCELAPPCDLLLVDDRDRSIALASAERLCELSQRAGAIYWASTIARVILAAHVKALHEQLGEPLCALALAHHDLSGPEQPLEPVETIGARIKDDGLRCLAAWCASQPGAVNGRVRLKLAAGAAFDIAAEMSFRECGPAIVRRIAV